MYTKDNYSGETACTAQQTYEVLDLCMKWGIGLSARASTFVFGESGVSAPALSVQGPWVQPSLVTFTPVENAAKLKN